MTGGDTETDSICDRINPAEDVIFDWITERVSIGQPCEAQIVRTGIKELGPPRAGLNAAAGRRNICHDSTDIRRSWSICFAIQATG